jgi:hypothetical protein
MESAPEFCLGFDDGYSFRSLIEPEHLLLDTFSFTLSKESLVIYHTYPNLITNLTIPLIRLVPGFYAHNVAKTYQVDFKEMTTTLKNCGKGKCLILFAYANISRLFVRVQSGESSEGDNIAGMDMLVSPTTPDIAPGFYSWKNNLMQHIITDTMQNFVNKIKAICDYKTPGKCTVYRNGVTIEPICATNVPSSPGLGNGKPGGEEVITSGREVKFGNKGDGIPLYVIEISENKLKWLTKFSKNAKIGRVLFYLPSPNYGMLHLTIIVGNYAEQDITLMDERKK